MGKKNSKQNKIWIGFDIETEAGPVLHPLKIQYWKQQQFKKQNPDSPFYFHADALVGLSLIHLNMNLQNPFASPDMNYSFANEAWNHLEPHHELFGRAQPRIEGLRGSSLNDKDQFVKAFERQFSEVLEAALLPNGLAIQHLHHLLEQIDYFESKLGKPLLYNFDLQFGKPITKKLHYLHSLLFHLRTLIAMDYNAHLQDVTHQAIQVDSITDYISKGEYIANDALLYLSFTKLKDLMPEPVSKALEKNFFNLLHNGSCLIKNLPRSFLGSMSQSDLEDSLYLVQMDWLLGTDSGLLFRIREELYGLVEGYDKVFWPELEDRENKEPHKLSVNCLLTENDLYPSQEVA